MGLERIAWFTAVGLVSGLTHAATGTAGPAEPWRGNRIGISDVPPPPFTAMSAQVRKGTAQIDCWGRRAQKGTDR